MQPRLRAGTPRTRRLPVRPPSPQGQRQRASGPRLGGGGVGQHARNGGPNAGRHEEPALHAARWMRGQEERRGLGPGPTARHAMQHPPAPYQPRPALPRTCASLGRQCTCFWPCPRMALFQRGSREPRAPPMPGVQPWQATFNSGRGKFQFMISWLAARGGGMMRHAAQIDTPP